MVVCEYNDSLVKDIAECGINLQGKTFTQGFNHV